MDEIKKTDEIEKNVRISIKLDLRPEEDDAHALLLTLCTELLADRLRFNGLCTAMERALPEFERERLEWEVERVMDEEGEELLQEMMDGLSEYARKAWQED